MKTVLVLCLISLTTSQLIIPKRQLGYVYYGASNNALIHLDIHLGPLCPDSRDTFPVVKQVAEHYGKDNLKLTVHMFPLPYHFQSYLTAIGAQVVKKLADGDATAYTWFQTIYSNLDRLSNDVTANITRNDVIRLLSNFASSLGVSTNSFVMGMQSEELEINTRTAWKYSCSRNVASTPTYFLNDVPIEADPTWTLSDWQQVIDPLLHGIDKSPAIQDCPTGTEKCEYLPHKFECCTKGENCIPNVGCRCFGENCETSNPIKKDCPVDTKKCEYLPNKVECCPNGENCIPNVGCRCFGENCQTSKTKNDIKDCPVDTKKCEYLPNKVECCPNGENCIPNVGCRCFGENCQTSISNNNVKDCPANTKSCEYLPHKIECCTKGEACIPNVGCRCWGEDCQMSMLFNIKKDCPTGTKKCEYLPGKEECCTDGEKCIPDVGCRCFESENGCRKLTDTNQGKPIAVSVTNT